MQISSLSAKNLRGLCDITVNVGSLTALIGANNSGKSTILKAIELFFDAAPKLTQEDFTAGHAEEAIEITIEFSNVTALEKKLFGSAVIDEKLQVTRHFSLTDNDSGQYSVTAYVNPVFGEIRAETNGNTRRSAYTKLQHKYDDLKPINTHTEIEQNLSEWENSHAEQLEKRKIRGFFGAINVANGRLKRKTNVHLVPAVQDAAEEASDTKRSPLLSLLASIARQTIENRQEIADFLEQSNLRFQELADPTRIPELAGISAALTENVNQFYSDSALEAQWIMGDGITVNFPTPKVVVDHSGITTELERVGHGLQRAALFSIVKFLAERVPTQEGEGELPDQFESPASDIIILIEEPEIYQHPSKQIVIYDAFRAIVESFNKRTGIRVQLIYTTHSEKMIRVSDFENARIIRRKQAGGKIENSASSLSLSACSSAVAKLLEPPREPMSDQAFAAKLHIFTREVCEGFFAKKLILTEGGTDRSILEAAYLCVGRNIHSESISVISVEGKGKLDKPGFIFHNLGIPTHIVFDNDAKKPPKRQKPNLNRLIQKICDVEDPVDWPEECNSRYTAIKGDLEVYLKECLGADKYVAYFSQVSADYGLPFGEIKKTPAALSSVFFMANEDGIEFPLLKQIIETVDGL